jgi:hypothetical protein
MARKIQGAFRSMLGQVEFHEQQLPLKNPGAFMPAIIVVGDRNDEVPRVFTEGEVRKAAMEEPELPDDMPDEMWEACRTDRATMIEALRTVMRMTRDGILNRLANPS